MHTLEINGITYNAYTDDERKDWMDEYVRDSFEYFNFDFLVQCLDTEATRKFFESIYDEWNRSYANDIETESDHTGEYNNRLEQEMAERGVDNIDDFVDDLTADQLNEGHDGLQHYIDNFGREEAMTILKNNSYLIDFEEMAELAVRYDGYGHFMNSYDGGEIEFEFDGETYYAYRD